MSGFSLWDLLPDETRKKLGELHKADEKADDSAKK